MHSGFTGGTSSATVSLPLDMCSHVLPDRQRDAAEVMNGVLRPSIQHTPTGAT